MNLVSRRLRNLALVSLVLVMSLMLSVTVVSADGHADDSCVIPESGPWPPCATGGNTTNSGNMGDDCVIPPSGPWPPCATGGNSGGGAANPGSGDDCVIPPSGPWPPCATGGNSGGGAANPGGGNNGGDCVIPESGPWPPCATNGNGGGAATPDGDAGADAGNDDGSADGNVAPPEIEIIDFITIYYVSNPEDIIGVFPVIAFNAELLVAGMIFNQAMLNEMRGNLDSAASGDQASCDRFEDAYEAIKENAIFFVDIPVDWQDLDFIYFVTFINSLDRTRPAYLSCFDSGRIDNFNRDLARQTIDETLNALNPGVEAALIKLLSQ